MLLRDRIETMTGGVVGVAVDGFDVGYLDLANI